MKKLLLLLATLSLALTAAVPALAADAPVLIAPAPASCCPIQVDGQEVGEARLLIPLRKTAEALGFTVVWKDGTVLVDNGATHAEAHIGLDQYRVSAGAEAAPFSLGAVPYVADGVTYVPLEFFDALLGGEGSVTVSGGVIRIRPAPMPSPQIPSPFVDCADLAEAAGTAGFSFTVPEKAASAVRVIQAIRDNMIQVIDTSGGAELCLRKAVGTADISGDYTAYDTSADLTVDARQVHTRGNGGLIHVAVWTEGGCAYSIHSTSGLDTAAVTALVRAKA